MKVGDYVRTKYGITQIKENVCLLDDIIKSSPNIIDLLEPNDFIKYKLIYNGYEKNQILYKCIKDGRDLLDLKYRINNKKISIKSILTKEQFESMEYKIGE